MTPGRSLGSRLVYRLLWCVCLMAVVGCDTHSPRPVVRFWAIGREGEVLEELLRPFSQAHPEMNLKIERLPWTGAHAKLLTAVAGESTPDICQLGNTWVPELVALKALMPVDGLVSESATVTRTDYFEGIWATTQMRGVTYAVPWYVDTRLLFYRKDILKRAGFDHPPKDWAEWDQQLVAIKRLNPKNYSIFLPLNEFEPMVALGLQQATPFIDEAHANAQFNSTGFRNSMQFYMSLFERDLASKMTDQQISNVWTEFGRGFFAFYISGPWNITEFKKRLPKEVQDQWSTAPLPGPHGAGESIAGGASLAIFKNSAHAKEAWAVVEYLSQPAVQERFHELTGDLPPRRSTWLRPAIANDPYAVAFRTQLERVKPTPRVPEWEQIATELRVLAEHVVLGDYDLDEGLRRLNDNANRILAKRRALLADGVLL
jgi:multiple sugar transport system substrate-binding protein